MFCTPELKNLPASEPIITQLAAVLFKPAWKPIKVFSSSVVIAEPASTPIRVFLTAVEVIPDGIFPKITVLFSFCPSVKSLIFNCAHEVSLAVISARRFVIDKSVAVNPSSTKFTLISKILTEISRRPR